MDYDADAMFPAVAAVAARGWKIVRLWGVRDDLSCTCGKRDCQTPGKHPSGGAGWQHRATDNEEEILSWFEAAKLGQNSRCNVGLRLGATSGIVDVEFDNPHAEETLKNFGLDLIDTPAYSSGRGVHRLFQHEDWMPDSAVVKVSGLEVRIGGGEMASQSVLPPSWHKTGKQYQWLPGRSPEDIHPARLPVNFRDAILAASRRHGSGVIAQAREALRGGNSAKISEGGRHAFLVGMASRQASRIQSFVDAERIELTEILLALNERMCDPPKSESEVVKIAHDQFAHYRDRQVERRTRLPYEKWGLVWNSEDRCYDPGQWRMTVVYSDPKEYKIRIPNPDKTSPPYVVRIDSKQFQSARDVSNAILECTGRINMNDPNAARWVSIWNGENIQDGGGDRIHVQGLSAKLLADADDEYPPVDASATVNNYSILLAYLSDFPRVQLGNDSDANPNPSGAPKWLLDETTGEWSLWLRWRVTLASAWRKAGMPPPNEKVSQRMLGGLREESVQLQEKQRKIGGKAQRYFVFSEQHLEVLQRLSGVS